MTREDIHKLTWKAQEYINELERKLALFSVVPSTLNRPDGLEDDEWYCPNCKCVVPPHEVTNDERHGIEGCLAKVN
jgi:hypothetical protein